MKKLNYTDANELMLVTIKVMHNKFKSKYPDTFTKCNTLYENKIAYNNANGCMYSWYMKFVEALDRLRFSPKYSQTREEISNSNWICVKRFSDDFDKSNDWLGFLIQNIQTT